MTSIRIVALEELPGGLQGPLSTALWQVFGLPVVVEEEFDDLRYAWDEARGQVNSVMVLRELHRMAGGNGGKVLAVTGRDLFIPMLSFVFGQAQLGGPVGVVSLARLRQEFYGLPPNPGLTVARAVKEAIHELGHMFGLTHCHDLSCPMSLSTGILQADRKGTDLCLGCGVALEKTLNSMIDHSNVTTEKTP
jgi:archaemetzincin